MRSRPSAVLLSVLVPLSVVALPVVSVPRPTPHAVAATVTSHRLVGIDAGAGPGIGGGSGQALRGSARASTLAWSSLAPSTRGAAPGRPEMLAGATGVKPFELLGVTWARTGAPADLTLLVRTHRASSTARWTGWTTLDVSPAPGGREGRTARPGTEPLWVGASDGYQVRVDVRRGNLPRGLRIDLVDPGTSAADKDPGSTSGRPMQAAQADTGAPAIFTRAQWGADERIRRSAPSYTSTIKAGFVHHTAGTNDYTPEQVPQILRGIYAYHVMGNGWSDVGYNMLVDKWGRLWEGRYGGLDKAVLGAHTGGFNVDSFAVSAIGNYDKAPAPAVMVDAIARAMAWKLALNNRNPNGTTVLTSQGGGTSKYRAGTSVTVDVISGHRNVGNTSCPGTNLYAQLPTIRALVTTYLGTAMFDPTRTPASAVYGSGATITIGAGVNTDQQWALEVREACRGTVVRRLTGTASPLVPLAAVWDLRDESGNPVRPGAYAVTLTSADAAAPAHPWVGQVTVQATRTTPPVAAPAALPGETTFVPVDPVKVFDTRADSNLPLGPGSQVDVPVPGVGRLPATGIAAVALSIASTCSTSGTAVTTWAAGSPRPTSPSLNVTAGLPSSALAVTPVGGNGAISIANSLGTTELTVHVVGYYPLAGGQVYKPMGTLRLYDSRRDPAGMLAPGGDRLVTMPALTGIPAAAMTGAMLNVTAVSPAGTGSLTVQSSAGDRDNATVSFAAGSLVKSRAVARLQDGKLKLTAHTAATHVVVDVVGWWAPPEVVGGRLFQSRATTRVLDTRYGIGVRAGRLGPGKVVSIKVAGRGRPAPAGVGAVVMNLTARDATRATFVTAWPAGRRRPAFPDLSVPAWRTTANLVVVRVGKKGRVLLTNGVGTTHLVADVVGYYP